VQAGSVAAHAAAPEGMELATFAGVSQRLIAQSHFRCMTAPQHPGNWRRPRPRLQGCFWGLELAFQRVPGVVETAVGYTQGQVENPTYHAVCSGSTGHAEAVQVTYIDPALYPTLLDVFFQRTDPTTMNRQGNDRGTQYRSGIYYHSPEQKAAAEAALAAAQDAVAAGTYGRSTAGTQVAVELKPASVFYVAEEYHQRYLQKGGQCSLKGCGDSIRCYG
jgi:peptide-methionine (S)-S-oxide reductase